MLFKLHRFYDADDAGGESQTGAQAGSSAASADADGSGQDEPEKKFTQADVDRIVNKKYAQWARQQDKSKPPDEGAGDTAPPPEYAAKLAALQSKLAQEQIKSSLATAGVRPERIDRAARMIDAAALLDDGELDSDGMAAEITKLLKEIPELKALQSDAQKPGFKLGGDGKQNPPANTEREEIAKQFGVKL